MVLKLSTNVSRFVIALIPMLAKIKNLATTLAPRLIEIRRHLHTYPELSGQEHQTAAYVAGVLSSSGLQVQEGVGKTGVVANLKGQGSDLRNLAIRTDMDASTHPRNDPA